MKRPFTGNAVRSQLKENPNLSVPQNYEVSISNHNIKQNDLHNQNKKYLNSTQTNNLIKMYGLTKHQKPSTSQSNSRQFVERKFEGKNVKITKQPQNQKPQKQPYENRSQQQVNQEENKIRASSLYEKKTKIKIVEIIQNGQEFLQNDLKQQKYLDEIQKQQNTEQQIQFLELKNRTTNLEQMHLDHQNSIGLIQQDSQQSYKKLQRSESNDTLFQTTNYICSYCNQDAQSNFTMLNCLHCYHTECLKEYIQNLGYLNQFTQVQCHCRKSLGQKIIRQVCEQSFLIILARQIESLKKKYREYFLTCSCCEFFYVSRSNQSKNSFCPNCLTMISKK